MENRKSFFDRLRPIFPPKTVLDIELAYTLAKFGHRWQFRKETDDNGKRVRYFEHPRRVALIVIDEVRCLNPDIIIAALLHDAVEDTRDLTPELLEHALGSEVTRLVRVLSKVPKEGYIERLMGCSDWKSLLIKACDRLDNLRSLHAGDAAFRKKQVDETVEKYYPMLDLLVSLVKVEGSGCPLEKSVRRIRAEIRSLVLKYASKPRGTIGAGVISDGKGAAARARRGRRPER